MTTAIVVDDDVDTVEVCSEYLELKGIRVLGTGTDGKQAVQLYDKLRPDVVFLDVMMPSYDGIYALEHIRKINPKAIVVIATADKRYDSRKSLEGLEASGIVYKPYDINEILAVVSKVLSGHKIYEPF